MEQHAVSVCVLAADRSLVDEISRLLSKRGNYEIVYTGTDAERAFEHGKALQCVLVAQAELLFDTENGTTEDLDLSGQSAIVIYSSKHGPKLIDRATQAGARACLHRDSIHTGITAALSRVTRGEFYLDSASLELLLNADSSRRADTAEELAARYRNLSARERDVFVRLGRGMNPRAIAEELGISRKTVETHQAHVYHKLDAENPVELFHIARRLGLEETDGQDPV
jgi:DNA-binding NarL/FixJ family response regulator